MKSVRVFDFYLFKNLFIATAFIAVTLAVIIFLTQSLRFIELVVSAGASSFSFWLLTLLALPRFFEIILPLSLMAATVFTYYRMAMDSELLAMRATGAPPLKLARPALALGAFVTLFLFIMTMWAAPASVANMQQLRQVIKAQFSTLLFREGVFNSLAPGLTVYLRERGENGELRGLMIYDSRDKMQKPSTIVAKRGVVAVTDEGHQVFVYEGSRQEFDQAQGALQKLNFERYTIDLPDDGPVRQRWKEPDERSIGELLNPDMSDSRDVEALHEFRVEIHRRLITPFLALVFPLLALNALLIGPQERRGQSKRIAIAIISVVVVQGLFLTAFNLSRQSIFGLVLMYLLVFGPLVLATFMLTPGSEKLRRRILYRPGRAT